MIKRHLQGLGGGVVLALVLGGCGGGGGGDAGSPAVATPAAVQPEAIAKALAYIAAQQSLPSTDIDPQTLRQTLPAADDTIEPAPV